MEILEIRSKVEPILRKNGVLRASIFGSVARGDDKPDSDLDMLVQLGRPMGLFTYMRLINDLEQSLGKKVDLVTESSLNKFVKPYVLPELKTVYEG